MKVIFLDINGVLTSRASAMLQAMSGEGRRLKPSPLHTGIVNEIARKMNAVVVITSTWRRTMPYKELLHALDAGGLDVKMVGGVTPYLPGKERDEEIQDWLDSARQADHEYDGMVIIDDDSDMAHLHDYHLKTETWDGLLATHVPEIIRIMNKKIKQEVPGDR